MLYFGWTGLLNFQCLIRNSATFNTQVLTCSCLHVHVQCTVTSDTSNNITITWKDTMFKCT